MTSHNNRTHRHQFPILCPTESPNDSISFPPRLIAFFGPPYPFAIIRSEVIQVSTAPESIKTTDDSFLWSCWTDAALSPSPFLVGVNSASSNWRCLVPDTFLSSKVTVQGPEFKSTSSDLSSTFGGNTDRNKTACYQLKREHYWVFSQFSILLQVNSIYLVDREDQL